MITRCDAGDVECVVQRERQRRGWWLLKIILVR